MLVKMYSVVHFSSHELNFSDRLLSVVCPYVCKFCSPPELKAPVSFSNCLSSGRMSVNFPHFNIFLQNHANFNKKWRKASLCKQDLRHESEIFSVDQGIHQKNDGKLHQCAYPSPFSRGDNYKIAKIH